VFVYEHSNVINDLPENDEREMKYLVFKKIINDFSIDHEIC